jgi:hypothetical protein
LRFDSVGNSSSALKNMDWRSISLTKKTRVNWGAIGLKAFKVRADLQHAGAREVGIVSVATVSQVISRRCAIHGTVMNYRRRSTYFCAECLGITPLATSQTEQKAVKTLQK